MTQHSKFLERLDRSRPAVFKVAEFLHKEGFTVTIPAIEYAPTAADHTKFVDNGDIIAEKGSKKHRIEVKHLSIDFHDAKSFPYKVAFISNVAAVNRAEGSVTAYVIVNKNMTHIGIAWTSLKDKWVITHKVAKNTNNMESNYACDPILLDYREL